MATVLTIGLPLIFAVVADHAERSAFNVEIRLRAAHRQQYCALVPCRAPGERITRFEPFDAVAANFIFGRHIFRKKIPHRISSDVKFRNRPSGETVYPVSEIGKHDLARPVFERYARRLGIEFCVEFAAVRILTSHNDPAFDFSCDQSFSVQRRNRVRSGFQQPANIRHKADCTDDHTPVALSRKNPPVDLGRIWCAGGIGVAEPIRIIRQQLAIFIMPRKTVAPTASRMSGKRTFFRKPQFRRILRRADGNLRPSVIAVDDFYRADRRFRTAAADGRENLALPGIGKRMQTSERSGVVNIGKHIRVENYFHAVRVRFRRPRQRGRQANRRREQNLKRFYCFHRLWI